MTIQIKHVYTGSVLWESEKETYKEAVEEAVSEGASLSNADLRAVYLCGASLSGAILAAADLSASNLSAADLSGADLYSADLRACYLNGANLRAANLIAADLSASNLCAANLYGADLGGADLRGADLGSANLSSANLSGADLNSASLRDATLSSADLSPIRDDFYDVLLAVSDEVPALITALKEGWVNGSAYDGECVCLIGTIANARGCHYEEIPGLKPDANRPIERFFMSIREGDTPESNQFSALAVQWAEEWLNGEWLK